MHDFQKFVAPGRKQEPREHEIVNELAGHLEEIYTDLRRAGTSEEMALARVSAIGSTLGPTVRRLRWQYEDGMTSRLRAVILPGAALSFLYAACKALLVDVYWEHPFWEREAGTWLIGIALGFCVSSFSRELGGTLPQRRWAGMLVILPYAAYWCVMALLVTPAHLVRWTQYRRLGTISGVIDSLLWVLLWDVIIPALGLAVGGMISARLFSSAPPDLLDYKTD